MRATLLACALLFVSGCAQVATREGKVPGIALDGLPVAAEWSDTTRETLALLAIDGDCAHQTATCARAVLDTPGTVREATRLLAAADLLHRGMQSSSHPEVLALDCVRHTARYLFDPQLAGRKSALDARSQLALRLHDACTADLIRHVSLQHGAPIRWQWGTDDARFPRAGVERIVVAAGVRTRGLRTRQVDDGLGVAAVAVGRSQGASLFPDQPFALGVNVRYVREGDDESLVVTDASRNTRVETALGPVDLARDTSAAYALAAGLFEDELTAWGALRRPADQVQVELRLLAPVDSDKTPLVLVHGFASSPMSWANLANELLGDPTLADHYQIWLARYPTGSPMLANRFELARAIGALHEAHVANGGDRAFVVVGHSMGGVLARLLATNSSDTVWNAAFARPPGALDVDAADDALARRYFLFDAMPGIDTVVFIAAPHGGSARADGAFAQIVRGFIAAPPKVLDVLGRIARGTPDAVQPGLRESYLAGGPSSVDTLSPRQPVLRAARGLPLASGITAYSLIGIADPRHPERGDGVVSLESAQWEGAHEIRIGADHHLQAHPATATALKSILLDRLLRMRKRPGPHE